MRLKPFFTYFGGKYRAAPKYPSPEHDVIVEPFAGSAGYAMRHPHRKVILNDLDEKVAGTWEYLINVSEDEILSLPVYDGTWATVDDLGLPQEPTWLIGWWLNKGAAQPHKSPSKWMRDATDMGENLWGEGVKARIARQLPHIRHWQIHHGSYADLPAYDATYFVDPPYQVAGKGYRHNGVDYDHLAQWCKTRPGQVIACENEGADWLPFSFLADIKGTEGKGRTGVSKEVIWTNTATKEKAA